MNRKKIVDENSCADIKNDDPVNAGPRVKQEEVYGRSVENVPESIRGKAKVHEYEILRKSRAKQLVERVMSIYRKCVK